MIDSLHQIITIEGEILKCAHLKVTERAADNHVEAVFTTDSFLSDVHDDIVHANGVTFYAVGYSLTRQHNGLNTYYLRGYKNDTHR